LTEGDNKTLKVLSVPTNLSSKATEDELKEYSSLNPWNTELNNLLSNLYVIFDLDNKENKVSFADSNTIISKLEEMLSDDFDLLTSSQIIMYTLTSTIDGYMSEEYIDTRALNKAKINGSYDKDELRSVLTLLEINKVSLSNIESLALKFTSAEGFNFIDIDKKTVNSKDEKESDMYFNNPNLNFYLIRGLITKQILNIDDINPHPYSFDDNASYLFKKAEIVSALSLFTNTEGKIVIDVTSLNSTISTLTIKKVESIIGSSTCTSYLVVGILSDALLQKEGSFIDNNSFNQLTIPSTCLDIFKNITFIEIKNLLNSIKILSGITEDENSDITISKLNISISSDTKISTGLMKSQIINATITKQLNTLSIFGGYDVGIEKKAAITAKDLDNKTIVLLSTAEVNALISLKEMGSINPSQFTSLDDDSKDKVLSSSIMRVIISEYFYSINEIKIAFDNKLIPNISYDLSTVYNLGSDVTSEEVKIFTKTEISNISGLIQ